MHTTTTTLVHRRSKKAPLEHWELKRFSWNLRLERENRFDKVEEYALRSIFTGEKSFTLVGVLLDSAISSRSFAVDLISHHGLFFIRCLCPSGHS